MLFGPVSSVVVKASVFVGGNVLPQCCLNLHLNPCALVETVNDHSKKNVCAQQLVASLKLLMVAAPKLSKQQQQMKQVDNNTGSASIQTSALSFLEKRMRELELESN